MILVLFFRAIVALERLSVDSFTDFHRSEIYPDILGKTGVDKKE